MTSSAKEFKQAKKSAERAIDETRKAAEYGVRAGRAKLEETGERLGEAGDKVGREAAGQIREIRDGARDGYDRVAQSLEELRGEIGSYGRDHIVGSVLMASAIGFCLGFFLSRRGARASSRG